MRFRLILNALPAAAFMFFATECTREASQSEPAATTPELESAADEPAIPASIHLTPAAIAEPGITTWKIQPVDIEHRLTLNGTVGYNENRLLQVAGNIRGRVTAIPVDIGARVRRTILDWQIAPRLRTVLGVTEVNAWGGQLENRQAATRRLAVVVRLALALIFAMLSVTFAPAGSGPGGSRCWPDRATWDVHSGERPTGRPAPATATIHPE